MCLRYPQGLLFLRSSERTSPRTRDVNEDHRRARLDPERQPPRVLRRQDKGLYDAAGLDVKIVSPADAEYDGSYNPGDRDADAPGAPKYVTPCSKVAEGSAHFAMNSPEGVVGWNTAPGRPQLKAVAALLRDRNTSAIVTLKSSGINSMKDLDGKRYASYAARFEGRIVQRMIQHAGGVGDYVEDTPPMLGIWNTLLEGEADATWVFTQWEGVEAKLKGVELNAFPVCDFGVPYAYAPCLCAHPEWLASNASAAKAFLKATAEGYAIIRRASLRRGRARSHRQA